MFLISKTQTYISKYSLKTRGKCTNKTLTAKNKSKDLQQKLKKKMDKSNYIKKDRKVKSIKIRYKYKRPT